MTIPCWKKGIFIYYQFSYLTLFIFRRETKVSDLIQSYDVYEDLLAKTNKGTEFYRKLESNVLRLLDRVKGVCKLQEEERQQVRNRQQTKPSTETAAVGKI